MPSVNWTPTAKTDLFAITFFIGEQQNRPATAEQIVRGIHAKCDVYAAQPALGSPRQDLGEDFRAFHHTRYVIVYRPIADGIEVVRVVDGARDFTELF